MLTYETLPKHIKNIAEEYNYRDEKLLAVPYRFHYNGQNYYCIGFEPSRERLFIREDGYVPSFSEMKRPMLLTTSYETSGLSMFTIGVEWGKPALEKLYREMANRFKSLCKKTKKTAPETILSSLDRVIAACEKSATEQKLIYDCVIQALDLTKRRNEEEMATEEDQKQLRRYVLEMTRATVRQNQVQLDTEQDRKDILDYLGGKILKNPAVLFDFLWLKSKEKHMVTADSPRGRDQGEFQKLLKEDRHLEEGDNAEIIALLRNPK
ncbi:hypothetical protein QNH23_17050 [Siminovitchia fortis]|uniref:Uncharacterized protein n=1 Tax=Siminovitchia fortis TaxID=254758 RepID=A0A443ILA9_9BACI|nr:hypothetical protein [Siminovitchia fortis]RWR06123.1 hypothetical protein D4N35_014650 [Siminovitchia fortis]WHY81556.1 hypothetical protein QNH23_17050 [Siminovitchia fortis]